MFSQFQRICPGRTFANLKVSLPAGARFAQRHLKVNPVVCYRCMSSQETIMNVFDRKTKRMQKNRTAQMKDYEVYEYVKDEIGYRVFDRVCDVKRKFNTVVDLGCGRGYASKHMLSDMAGTIFQCDMAEKVLAQSQVSPEVPTFRVITDEEFIPFKDNSLDLVISSLSMHWVNDLPGSFRQIYNALKPDGCFIGAMFGGDTLYELRVALQLAEQEIEGGFAPHISPFTEASDLGNLMSRAGYTLLTIDVDEMQIVYPGLKELMEDLQGMGESNCAWKRPLRLNRKSMELADKKYREMYGTEDGRGIPATYSILYMIGWKPDPTQPKAVERGSGDISLKDLSRLDELVKDIETARGAGTDPGNKDK